MSSKVYGVYPSRRDPGYYAVIVLYSDEDDERDHPMIALCRREGDALMIAAALNNADESMLDVAQLVGKILEES